MKKRIITVLLIFVCAAAGMSFAGCFGTPATPEPQPVYYSVTFDQGTGGRISLSQSGRVEAGSDIVIAFVPDVGYETRFVIINGEVFDVQSDKFTIEGLDGDKDISVVFSVKQFDFTVQCGAGGTARFSDDVQQNMRAFSVTPDKHYYISRIAIGGEEIELDEQTKYGYEGAVSALADCLLECEFRLISYRVIKTDPLGLITLSAEEFTFGEEVSLSVALPEGGTLLSLLVNGREIKDELTESGDYTLKDYDTDVTIVIDADCIKYNVSVRFDDGIESAVLSATQVVNGGKVTLAVTAKIGHSAYGLTVNGKPAVFDGRNFILENIQCDTELYVTSQKKVYKVTAVCSEGGSIDSSRDKFVYGDTVDIYVDVAPGYTLVSFTVNGEKCTAEDGVYTVKDMAEDILAQAEFAIEKYSITVMKSRGGTVTSSHSQYTVNDNVELSVKADAGYTLKALFVNGDAVRISDDVYSFPSGTYGALSVVAEFTPIRYKAALSFTGNGTASISRSYFTVEDEVVVSFTPDEGYDVISVTINGESAEYNDDKIIITDRTSDIEVSVVFGAKKYKVHVAECTGGTVTYVPQGGFTKDDTVTLIFTPDAGYVLGMVTVNGVVTPAQANRITLRNQQDDIYVTAEFNVVKYSVTINAEAGGTVTADKNSFTRGQSVEISVATASGYKLISLAVNGSDMTKSLQGGKLTLSGYEQDIVVSVVFAKDTDRVYSLSSDLDPEVGQVLFTSTSVSEGKNAVFAISMNDGYKVEKVTAGGKVIIPSDGVYKITGVTSDMVVSVEYSLIAFRLTVEKNDKVSVEVASTYTAKDVITAVVTAAPGYKAVSVEVDGEIYPINNGKASFGGKAKDMTLSVITEDEVYKLSVAGSNKYTISASANEGGIKTRFVITVTAASYYRITHISINGTLHAFGGGEYVIEGIDRDTTVSAVAEGIEYNITIRCYTDGVSSEKGGVVTANMTSYTIDDVVTFTVTEKEGYYLSSVTVGGIDYTEMIKNGKFTYSGRFALIVVANFSSSGIEINGRVSDFSSGKAVSGAVVTISGAENYTLRTDAYGHYNVKAANGTYTVSVSADGYKYCEKRTITGNNGVINADLNVANSSFGNAGNKTSDLSKAEFGFDFAMGGENVAINGSTPQMYFRDKVTGDFAVTFTAENTCDRNTNYEKEPGIGIVISTPSDTFTCQFVAKRARVIINDDWSNVKNSPDSGMYDFNVLGEKRGLAFVKTGDIVIFMAKNDEGVYVPIFSYSDKRLDTVCDYGFYVTKRTNEYSLNMNFTALRVYDSCYALPTSAKSAVSTVQTPGGYLVVENMGGEGLVYGKKYRIYAYPDSGMQAHEILLDGQPLEITSDGAHGAYAEFTATAAAHTVTARFAGTGNGNFNYSDGHGYGDSDYDRTLYYRNDLITDGADPGVMYVSEEEDPVNGGWFYMTVTSYRTYNATFPGNNTYYNLAGFLCYRSKDLATWEAIGAIGGYALGVKQGEWPSDCFWAPEMLRDPVSGKYLLYFSARSKIGNGTNYSASTAGSISDRNNQWDRLYLGIAMSDYPQGPYELISSEAFNKAHGINDRQVNMNGEMITGGVVPINFARNVSAVKAKGYDFWPAIDVSPFIDDDGTMYLYFSQHVSSVSYGNSIWCMKMKDYITPDYSTMTLVSIPGYTKVTSKGKADTIYFNDGQTYYNLKYGFQRYTYDGDSKGNGVNEGVNVIKDPDSGKYFLTYSPFGYGSRRYSIMQAVSDSPQGPFDKLAAGTANPVLGIYNGNNNVDYNMSTDISASIDYMAGTGHHCFVRAGNELFAVYHAFYNPINNNNASGSFMGRRIAADRVFFAYNDAIGYPVLVGNGPTDTLQAMPEVSSGYANVTAKATLTATNASGDSVKYLSDKLFVVHNFNSSKEFSAQGETTITASFDKPITARSVMLYSSYNYKKALKKVSEIKLFTSSGKTVVMKDINLNDDYVNADKKTMHYGGAIIADFDAITVNRIEITAKSTDKFDPSDREIRISDLVILAKADAQKAEDTAVFASGNGEGNSDGMRIDGKPFDRKWQNAERRNYTSQGIEFTLMSCKGESGVYYLFTAYNTNVYHADNSGNFGKMLGMRRFYKNTGWQITLYAGNSGYNSSKAVTITADAYNFIINSGKLASVATYVDGNVNGTVNSFAIEVFVSYSQFGENNPRTSYADVRYRNPASASVASADAVAVTSGAASFAL